MRLASILPRRTSLPVPAVEVPGGGWIELKILAERPVADMEAALRFISEHPSLYVRRAAEYRGQCLTEAEFLFLPPVVRPPSFRDFYAFEAHVKTARAKRGLEMLPLWYEIPVFYFSNPNALLGHGASVFAPAGSQELDYELELGIVIGTGGRNIQPADAWEHVAGLTILNDWSARDLQRKEVQVGLGPAKGKDFATSVGPYLLTIDEFSDRIEGERLTLEMTARVNGKELSRGNVATIHHSVPQLIAQASRDAELIPGDLIGSGTVGTGCILELGPENTGGWLKPGDVVELEIERLGVLRTPIVDRRD